MATLHIVCLTSPELCPYVLCMKSIFPLLTLLIFPLQSFEFTGQALASQPEMLYEKHFLFS